MQDPACELREITYRHTVDLIGRICKVRRLSAGMKREFVETLKTPALLAMFSKDPICTAYAHAAIKYLAALEPSIIMPLVLERSYNGLESVNEVMANSVNRASRDSDNVAADPSSHGCTGLLGGYRSYNRIGKAMAWRTKASGALA